MPKSKEFTVRLENKPGTLSECCRVLADADVNILAFEAYGEEQGLIRMIVDNPDGAKRVLRTAGFGYTETEVVQVNLPHRPGGLSRAASQLGQAHININYAYPGIDPTSNIPVVIFGVTDVAKAAQLLDEVARKEKAA
jgi:hypothetical protein